VCACVGVCVCVCVCVSVCVCVRVCVLFALKNSANGWTSHVTHMIEFPALIVISPVTHMNESFHTHEWVLPHIFMNSIIIVTHSLSVVFVCEGGGRTRETGEATRHELRAIRQKLWVKSHIPACGGGKIQFQTFERPTIVCKAIGHR